LRTLWSCSSGDRLDQGSEFPDQPVAEPGPIVVVAADQRDPFADQMSQTAAASWVIPVGAVSVGDQPTDDGVAEQVADFLVAPTADVEHCDGHGQHQPQPARLQALIPGGLVGVDYPGAPDLIQQILDDRLAGDTDLSDGSIDGADRQGNAEPCQQKFADFPT